MSLFSLMRMFTIRFLHAGAVAVVLLSVGHAAHPGHEQEFT